MNLIVKNEMLYKPRMTGVIIRVRLEKSGSTGHTCYIKVF